MRVTNFGYLYTPFCTNPTPTKPPFCTSSALHKVGFCTFAALRKPRFVQTQNHRSHRNHRRPPPSTLPRN
jgi:hypothetical protein